MDGLFITMSFTTLLKNTVVAEEDLRPTIVEVEHGKD